MKKIVLLLLIFGYGQPTLSESIAPEDIVSKTIDLLKKGKPEEAFDTVFA